MSRWMINCREATHLVLRAEDQALGLADRLQLRVHMAICAACPRFERQVGTMRRALQGWRSYREQDDSGPPPR